MKNIFKFFFSLILVWNVAVAQSDPSKTPRFVVNLLDYVAQDYAGAVSQGRVTSESEYQEQIEFLKKSAEICKELPELQNDVDVSQSVAQLLHLIQEKADASEVSALAQKIKNEIITKTKMEMAPAKWPSLSRGQELYKQNCVSCHGDAGKGDGAAGQGLDPKPADFTAADMATKPPFREFNVIRVGVPGTGMVPWNQLSDKDVWDLAFFVSSYRFHQGNIKVTSNNPDIESKLSSVASFSDEELLKTLPGSEKEKQDQLLAIKLHNPKEDAGSSLNAAREHLKNALDYYSQGKIDLAKSSALQSYLEGIEPVEPKLRANGGQEFISNLEMAMAGVRTSIERKETTEVVIKKVEAALQQISSAENLIGASKTDAKMAFLMISGIMLREGFEAILILVALIAATRALGDKRALLWIHAGWMSALVLGLVAWISSGWLMQISGASRETMEGAISLLSVVVLLYIGFWLHSKTEINKWKSFIKDRVETALSSGKLVTLGLISFMSVFREVFETVLFIRAIAIDIPAHSSWAIPAAAAGSLICISIFAWIFVKVSAQFPIRKIFSFSSVLICVLAIILAGKGVHAFQETGLIGISENPLPRYDLIGFFPTNETVLAQVAILFLVVFMWRSVQKKMKPSTRST